VINLSVSVVASFVDWVVVNLSPLIMTALNGDELPNYNCFAPEERWFDISFLQISVKKGMKLPTVSLRCVIPVVCVTNERECSHNTTC
jgi:hypothetical protein